MVWFIGGAVLVAALVAVGGWLAWPSIRSLFGPSFSPSPKDEESVLQAQQSYINTGGGAGAGI